MKMIMNSRIISSIVRSRRIAVLVMTLTVVGSFIIFCKVLPLTLLGRRIFGLDTKTFVVYSGSDMYSYDIYSPFIFIGGVPRSGTTLLRSLLDVHPDVRCGQETRVLTKLLQMRWSLLNSEAERIRLNEAGVNKEVLDSAMTLFFLEVMTKHAEPAPRLCNKDPLNLLSAPYIAELFPNSKFILMIRDGRAICHSIITRRLTSGNMDGFNYRQCLIDWNQLISDLYGQCLRVGASRCMMVYYEQLVLHLELSMRGVLSFLHEPWDERVLHHEDYVNKAGGVILSRVEVSSDQVIKPVNVEPLTQWVGHIPDDVIQDMAQLAPMLAKLGYDPNANFSNYGTPDDFVTNNTQRIKNEAHFWESRVKYFNITKVYN